MSKGISFYKGVFLVFFALLSYLGNSQGGRPADKSMPETEEFQHETPSHLYTIILSRPSDHAITISLMANSDLEGYYVYGQSPGKMTSKTEMISFEKGKPVMTDLNGLMSGSRYYYCFFYKGKGEASFNRSVNYFFQTARKAGSSFVFTIQADSHLDGNTSVKNYEQTLVNMSSDSADFLVDLGDTWMTDKFRDKFRDALPQYIAQRYYFSRVCHSSSLFLTLGNHDGEHGWGNKRNGAESMLQWSTVTRHTYYANPYPDNYYTGNKEKAVAEEHTADYYAWEWGDALFIVLDPFRYTKENRDPWQRTLGVEQYNWLKETLQKTKAAFRFVFIHNLVGGADNKGIARGGAEAAAFYEWGGWNADSTDGFTNHRPGWDMPIHQLLVKYKVNAVFHGHDHFYARQEKDGIIYQLLPQPGAMQAGNTRQAAEYGYTSGKIMNAPGYLRVTTDASKATIDFIQTDVSYGKKIADTYNILIKK